MPSTRTSSRRASPGAPSSRIPVPKASKAATKPTGTARRASPRRKVAVISRSTRVLRSSLSRTPTGANKENYPIFPRPGFVSRANPVSPSRMKKDGVAKKPFGKSSRVQRAKRQPLRELTEQEVFERDEAVMGDLRRRRVSGENYIVDGLGESVVFDSVLAQESAPPEVADSSEPEEVPETQPDSPLVVYKAKIEKFKVLRRSDSEERLQATMESIIATTSQTVVDSAKRPRTRAALAQRKQHPAVRTSLASIENHSPEMLLRSAENSAIKPLRKRSTRLSSPCSGTKQYAGIMKVQPSPSPLKVSRVGLGAKSANTAYVMKKVLEEGGKIEDKGKVTLKDSTTALKATTKKKTVTTTTTTMKETKLTTRKANSSLKRAAGVATGSSSARAGLAGIGRMR